MIPKNLLLTAVLSLLCLCSTGQAFSQKVPKDKYRHRATKDTLGIEFGEVNRIAIPVKTIYEFEAENLNELLRQLNQDLRAAMDSLAGTDAPVTVLYLETADGGRRLQLNSKPGE